MKMVILSNTIGAGNQEWMNCPEEDEGGAGRIKPGTGEIPIRFGGDVAFLCRRSPVVQKKRGGDNPGSPVFTVWAGGCLVDLRGIFRREMAGSGWLSVAVADWTITFRIRRPLCLPRGWDCIASSGAVRFLAAPASAISPLIPLPWRSQPDPGNGIIIR